MKPVSFHYFFSVPTFKRIKILLIESPKWTMTMPKIILTIQLDRLIQRYPQTYSTF